MQNLCDLYAAYVPKRCSNSAFEFPLDGNFEGSRIESKALVLDAIRKFLRYHVSVISDDDDPRTPFSLNPSQVAVSPNESSRDDSLAVILFCCID